MIARSFNPEIMRQALLMLPDDNSDIDCDAWVRNHNHVMLVDGDNIGLATFEYPGLYTVHWFYTVRGREAIKLARRMLDVMFTEYGAQAIRGITAKDLKAARWLAKQVGLTSYGEYVGWDGQAYEIQCITKQEFYNGS